MSALDADFNLLAFGLKSGAIFDDLLPLVPNRLHNRLLVPLSLFYGYTLFPHHFRLL